MPTKSQGGEKAVHQPLHLTSPLAKGPDVRALQSAVKKGLVHYKVDWLPMTIDGEFGRQTLRAARFYAWILGLGGEHRKALKKNAAVPAATQTLLRNPEKRSRRERRRSERRRPQLAKIRRRQDEGAKAAVAYAHAFLGTTENPAGSNSGPDITRNGNKGGISFWERYFKLPACYWCGCFAGFVAKAIGKAKLTGILTYGPDIIADANGHRNGLIAVPASESRGGDIPVYWGGEHIGFCVGPPSDGHLHTIEGNTSSDNAGDQSNGGGVFEKHRPFSDVTCVARPLY